MIWSAYLGLPLSLEGVGTVLKLKDQKMREGADLIRYFCVPCKPTKVNGGRIRNFPHHAPDKWSTFIDYNRRDVEVELAIKERLKNFPVPDFVWEEYHQDQIINDRGIGIDVDFVKAAIKIDGESKVKIQKELKALTGLENPNSVLQMIGWLRDHGVTTDSLDKKAVKELLKTVDETTAQVLKLRQQAAKSSVSKYQAMMNCVCKDSRARGMFQFYGANRTGRWAGRLVQLQNLPQDHLRDLEEARELFRTGDLEATELLYDTQDNLSQLIRTAFVPSKGKKFIVCDFSAIEARVLSHLAGERWRSKVFEQGKDIYCMSASQMFGVPVEKHGQNADLRQKGKIAELACGYGGSVGALKAMGALDMGLSEDELQPLVNSWRQANPNIVLFWWDVDKAVKVAVKELLPTSTQNIQFEIKSGILFITLPSGRKLAYIKPRIGENQFGGESVTYEGTGTAKRWERLESYGPKFVENIVQAISRDILHLVSKLNPSVSKGYRKEGDCFEYNKDAGIFVCPQGHMAVRKARTGKKKKKNRNQVITHYFDVEKCKICPSKEGCYKEGAQTETYSVTIKSHEHLFQKRFQETTYFKEMARNRYKIEAKNAELKQRHGLDVARASGLFNMELQAATTIFVVNMKRIMTLIDQKEE